MQDEDGIWGRPEPATLRVISGEEHLPPATVAAEYFLDQDPGEGQGTPIVGSFDGTLGDLDFTVETADLDPGWHVVYVRMQDEDGVWGRPEPATIQVIPAQEKEEAPVIVAAEYFMDTDPGEGRATPLDPEDGAFDTSMEAGEALASPEGFAPGWHMMYVRMKDEDGVWGRAQGQVFQVRPETPAGGEAEHRIAAAEYFIDTDPGEGNGIPMAAADGEFGGSFEDVAARIETAGLRVGDHTVFVRLQDEEGAWSKVRSIRFAVDEPPPEKPEMVVDDIDSHDFGTLRVDASAEWTFTVSNAAGAEDTLKVRSISVDAPFSVTPETFSLAPGESQPVRVTYLPTQEGTDTRQLIIRSNDTRALQLEIRLIGEAAEFGVPVAEIVTPDGEQSGQVSIEFRILDDDDSAVSVDFTYEVDGTQHPATVSGDTGKLTSDQYGEGKALGVVWDTDTDLAGRDATVRFLIMVRDEDHPDGKQSLTADFRVDNNRPPAAMLTAPTIPVGRVVEVAYSLEDPEEDILSLAGAYSTDGGTTWGEATIVSETEGITQYESSILWDAFTDLSYGTSEVRFRLTPSDNEPGEPGEAGLTVTHLVGDYTGDQRVDFEDLTRFLVAWSSSPRDTAADIGPAAGSVPDLRPVFDGILDFEDVVVLIQMWNWSIGLHPPAAKPLLTETGSDLLQPAEPEPVDGAIRLGLRLDGGPLLAAALEVQYAPEAWQLIEVTPGDAFPDPSGVLVLYREWTPGRAAVQLGSLTGPSAGAGSLVQLHFTPQGQGEDEITIHYDLRDPDGLRYGAGTVTRDIRPSPRAFFLGANVPNPFNPNTSIAYGLPEPARVTCVLYDMLGRRVTTLLPQGLLQAGYHRVSWNGRDEAGRDVGSGIYLYRLVARPTEGGGTWTETRRMVLLR